MIVTIDGPAGAGKSSVARSLAKKLGFRFLDTGAMYRAVAWAALQDGINLEDAVAVTQKAKNIRIRMEDDLVLVDGRDVSAAIRSSEVTECVRYAAGNHSVRHLLVRQQRQIGEAAVDLVTEGRDQGTLVFPNADCKIFLTATAEERAKRRYCELVKRGENVTFKDILELQNQRDARDANRAIAPLVKADDAIEVYTDDMTEEQVLNHLVWVVESAKAERRSD